jgi:NUMOD1 domain
MIGVRPHFSPSQELKVKLGLLAKNRIYDKAFRDAISERKGFTVYVYDTNGKLITTYPSIIRLKEAYHIKLHHKTLYKYIYQGKLFKGHRFSFSPLTTLNSDYSIPNSIIYYENNNLKPRKIQLINIVKPKLSNTFESLNSAAIYIKKMDGSSDRSTMRKYINSGKTYRKIWIISEII